MYGTQLLDHPDTSLPPPGGFEETHVVSASHPRGRRKWLAAAVAGGMALALVAGAFGGRASMRPQLDDVTAERDALANDIADLTAERELLVSDLTEVTTERDALANDIADLTATADADATTIADLNADLAAEQRLTAGLDADNTALLAAIDASLTAARIPALEWLLFDDEGAAEVAASGADLALANQLLADLGRDETIEEWTEGDRDWQFYYRAVVRLDEQLQQSLDRYYAAPESSSEELAAVVEFYWRLHHLILQPLVAAESSSSSAAG
jgi:hypothetical protein